MPLRRHRQLRRLFISVLLILRSSRGTTTRRTRPSPSCPNRRWPATSASAPRPGSKASACASRSTAAGRQVASAPRAAFVRAVFYAFPGLASFSPRGSLKFNVSQLLNCEPEIGPVNRPVVCSRRINLVITAVKHSKMQFSPVSFGANGSNFPRFWQPGLQRARISAAARSFKIISVSRAQTSTKLC